MDRELEKLFEAARHFPFSEADAEEQRRNFAYGNARLENKKVTRKSIDEAADRLVKCNDSEN